MESGKNCITVSLAASHECQPYLQSYMQHWLKLSAQFVHAQVQQASESLRALTTTTKSKSIGNVCMLAFLLSDFMAS